MIVRERGQILPLFAILIVVICAFAALAIDVSNVYAAQRSYRSIADAAALAGAQDLQIPGSRAITAETYRTARSRSLTSVERALGGTLSGCSTTGSTRTCTLTAGSASYDLKVVSPVPAGGCENCDVRRSIQVGISRPTFPLSFARVLGFDSFSVGITSVAGMTYGRKYTVVTLRPSQSGQTAENAGISIGGGTTLVVTTGDVATNGNLYIDNNSSMTLTDGYQVDYYDRGFGIRWNGVSPPGVAIGAPIKDPKFWRPAFEAQRALAPVDPDPDTDTNCSAIVAGMPAFYRADPINLAYSAAHVTCYKPGRYTAARWGSNGLTVGNGDWAILEPGIYFFEIPFVVQGGVIGGYTPGVPGVTLVFREMAAQFKLRTNGAPAEAVLLNAGSRSSFSAATGAQAAPALGFDGTTVIASNPTANPPDRRALTVVVKPNGTCVPFGPTPVWKLSAACLSDETNNDALDLAGSSRLYLGGVQYAPEDNVSITGGSAAGGYVGQLWAWTVTYGGGSRIVQEGSETTGPGLVRLDAACTAPGTVCIP